MIVKPTRRGLLKYAVVGGAAVRAVPPARPDTFPGDPAFSMIAFPDPQYLSANSGGDPSGGGSNYCGLGPSGSRGGQLNDPDHRNWMYIRMMNWVVENRAAWNIKGVISMGDCSDAISTTALNSQEAVTAEAWSVLRNAGIPDQVCEGNHDGAVNNGVRDGSYLFKYGIFSPPALLSFFGPGIALGAGDFVRFGGYYGEPLGSTVPQKAANSYTLWHIGTRRICILALEFYPRSEVLVWAKSVHDDVASQGYELWITTHGYLNSNGSLIDRGKFSFGPDDYGFADDGSNNSGVQMWEGNSRGVPTTGFKEWSNLTCVLNGHFLSSNYKYLPATSISQRAHTVHQFFCNFQGEDLASNCGGSPPDGLSNCGVVMILHLVPSWGALQVYITSTNSGNWFTGTKWQATRIAAAHIPLAGILRPRGRGVFGAAP